MYGAFLGDMIGAPYEFDRGKKVKDFPLFIKKSEFTDDSVMTAAVAEALMNTMGQDDYAVRAELVECMQEWGRKYPYAGYGLRFSGLALLPRSGTLRELRERIRHAGVRRGLAL